jgi:hypothetical protein
MQSVRLAEARRLRQPDAGNFDGEVSLDHLVGAANGHATTAPPNFDMNFRLPILIAI